MPRFKIPRKLENPPKVKGFKPYGIAGEITNDESVILYFEEYEAIRLCDYEMYNHVQASAIMNVSRPTFTRIYALARMKIAKALTEGKKIEIEGGKVYFDSEWYHCNSCDCYFNHPHKTEMVNSCPLCGSREIVQYSSMNKPLSIPENTCTCPKCGFTMPHRRGIACNQEVCPTCNTRMVRSRYKWNNI